MIVLAFDTEELRDLCLSEVKALQQFPDRVVRTLFRRLADLRAATDVLSLPLGNPTVISDRPPGELTIELCDGFLLHVSTNHSSVPTCESGSINWKAVHRLKLLKIRDE